MLFTDPFFLFFFLPVVLGCYYLAPALVKNLILVGASLFFYSMGEGYYTLLVLFSILLNFLVGLWIASDSQRDSRLALAVGVSANLLLLITFKYADFGVENINVVLGWAGIVPLRAPHVHLPLGISFFTFHSLSYLIDVWRREVPAMKRLSRFTLYILLFPQLIAGPIIRYKTICDQLAIGGAGGGEGGRQLGWEKFAIGVRRFIIGLGKKMLIANIVGREADLIFSLRPLYITPAVAWFGVICYTLQIYFDFSGYSDMAIGLGRMFGFVFPENFNYPYVATSITDFWRRWHITLSSWFRDYVYIPLGGSRVSRGRVYFNLLTVFFLCGLWHGAMWTFVVWGLFHGAFLIVERMALKDWLARHRIIRHVYVLTAVMFGWAIFRSSTIGAAGVYILRLCFLGGHSEALYGRSVLVNHEVLAALIAGIALSMPIIPAMARLWDRITATATGWRATASELMARLIEMGALAMVFLVSLALCAEGTYNPFIYFRF